MAKIKEIEINKIIRDDRYYPRLRPNWLTIYSYRQALQTGSIFPPIDVADDNGMVILIDGAHRLEAHKEEKRAKIRCNILDIPKDQFYVESVKRNIANALPFSPIEKKQIIVNLRKMKYRDDAIAEIIKMPQMRIEKFLSGCVVRTGLRDTVLKAPLKNMVDESNMPDDMELHQKIFNAGSQIQLLDQFLELLANNWIDYNNDAVVIRMTKIKELLKV